MILVINFKLFRQKYYSLIHQDFIMNKNEIIELLKIDGLKIAEVELPLRDDDELITTALKQNGLALSYLSEPMKAVREFVLLAIDQNPYSIQFAAQSLIDDLEILEAAYRRDSIASNFTRLRLLD